VALWLAHCWATTSQFERQGVQPHCSAAFVPSFSSSLCLPSQAKCRLSKTYSGRIPGCPLVPKSHEHKAAVSVIRESRLRAYQNFHEQTCLRHQTSADLSIPQSARAKSECHGHFTKCHGFSQVHFTTRRGRKQKVLTITVNREKTSSKKTFSFRPIRTPIFS
jgi:hypothetical protein